MYARDQYPGFPHQDGLDRRGPRESVSVTVQSFDDMHVFAVKIASDLVEPRMAVKP